MLLHVRDCCYISYIICPIIRFISVQKNSNNYCPTVHITTSSTIHNLDRNIYTVKGWLQSTYGILGKIITFHITIHWSAVLIQCTSSAFRNVITIYTKKHWSGETLGKVFSILIKSWIKIGVWLWDRFTALFIAKADFQPHSSYKQFLQNI